MKSRKIGVFDSGIGGVTVLKEIIKILPNEDYIYYSDSINNPYGDKDNETIVNICDKITKKLIDKNCKAIVIACNTASAKASQYLRNKYWQIPIIAIEPACKMIYDYAYDEPTLIMATKGTIESEKFQLLYKKYNNQKTYLLPCVGLADSIEKEDYKAVKVYLKEHVKPYKGKVKNVVLGCTHYPLIKKEIQEILGDVNFFNGESNLAKHLKEVLKQNKLLDDNTGNIQFIDSQGLEDKEKRFFSIIKDRSLNKKCQK